MGRRSGAEVPRNTIDDVAAKLTNYGLEGPDLFVETASEYNDAVGLYDDKHARAQWDPAIKDRLSTQPSRKKRKIPKLNSALPLDDGPCRRSRSLAV